MDIQSERKKPGEMTIREWAKELTIKQVFSIVLVLASLFSAGMAFQAWLKSQASSHAVGNGGVRGARDGVDAGGGVGKKVVALPESKPPSAMAVPSSSTTQGDCSPIVSGNSGEVSIESHCE